MWLSSLPLAVTLQSSNTDFSTISWHVGLMGETNRAATLSLYSTDDVSLHSAGNLINCLMTRKRDESWWLLAQVCFRTTAFPLIHIYILRTDFIVKGNFFQAKCLQQFEQFKFQIQFFLLSNQFVGQNPSVEDILVWKRLLCAPFSQLADILSTKHSTC